MRPKNPWSSGWWTRGLRSHDLLGQPGRAVGAQEVRGLHAVHREAMDAIEQATGEREINTAGYCLGGDYPEHAGLSCRQERPAGEPPSALPA